MSRREVRETYDQIAAHFAKTRPEAWPEVEDFLDGRNGAVGLDIGVGNGRHAVGLARRCDRVVGLDVSRAALEQTVRRARRADVDVAVLLGDAVALPLRNEVVDLAAYVATLHHLPTRSDRVTSLDELARVLRPSGRAIVSVWSVSHDRFDADVGFDTTLDWTLPDGEVVGRFYHIYDSAEFSSDIDSSGLDPVTIFESRGNCYAIVRPEQ